LDVSGAELAFSNGWRYGAPIPVGPITMEDIWNIIPTNPPVSVVDITGAELIDMLEENLENTFASDTYDQMGGYVKSCLGMKMYVKLENPAGMRVQDLFIGGEKVEKDRVYEAAFVTTKGVPEKYDKSSRHLNVKAVDVLLDYVEKVGVVESLLRGTVEVV